MAIVQPNWRVLSRQSGSSAGASQTLYVEPATGTQNGSNKVFTLTFSPAACSGRSPAFALWLFINGVLQSPYFPAGTPEYILSGNVITFATAPSATDYIEAKYFIKAPGGIGKARGFGTQGVNSADILNWGGSGNFKIIGDLGFGMWVKMHDPGSGLGVLAYQGHNADSGPAFNDLLDVDAFPSGIGFKIRYAHENGSGNVNSHDFTYIFLPDQWYYIGISRDVTAKTAILYVGDGNTVTLEDTFNFTNVPTGGQDPATRFVIGNGYPNQFPSNSTIEQHYLWSVCPTVSQHAAAMAGTPDTTGLVMNCQMGNTPEKNISVVGGTSTPTGTLLVVGH